jgi:hypothetical protein
MTLSETSEPVERHPTGDRKVAGFFVAWPLASRLTIGGLAANQMATDF